MRSNLSSQSWVGLSLQRLKYSELFLLPDVANFFDGMTSCLCRRSAEGHGIDINSCP